MRTSQIIIIVPGECWQKVNCQIEQILRHLKLANVQYQEPLPWEDKGIVQVQTRADVDAETAMLLCHRLIPQYTVDLFCDCFTKTRNEPIRVPHRRNPPDWSLLGSVASDC